VIRRPPVLDVLAAFSAAAGITLLCVALIDGTLYGRFLISLVYR
jgi:hypothetical protein